jgi:hypothetical protein
MVVSRKLSYVVRYVALGWIVLAAVIGIIVGLAHILKNTMATIMVSQLLIYSCLFGFLGWQLYKSKSERAGWNHRNDDRGWGRVSGWRRDDLKESGDSENGWK